MQGLKGISTLIGALVSVASLLAEPGISQAETTKWPTTLFEVCDARPSDDPRFPTQTNSIERAIEEKVRDSVLRSTHSATCRPKQPIDKEIERYMSDVAARNEKLGFAAPQLKPIVDTPAGPAYRIYVYDYADRFTHARYASPCAGEYPHVKVDRKRAGGSATFRNGKITTKGFGDLAHELFHAIQASYPTFKKNCHVGDWIVEGTAEAVGIDMAKHLRGVVPNPKNPAVRWSARRYSERLFVADEDRARTSTAYNTASFWRYLGEHSTARRRGDRASKQEGRADYRYLHRLFSRPLRAEPRKGREKLELDWLDRGMSKIFDRQLASLYPSFLIAVSGYVPTRTSGTVSNTGKWYAELFRPCRKVAIKADEPTPEYSISLEPVSAKCFTLTFPDVDTSTLVRLHVKAKGNEESAVALKSLAIGIASDTRTAPATIMSLPSGCPSSGYLEPRAASSKRVFGSSG